MKPWWLALVLVLSALAAFAGASELPVPQGEPYAQIRPLLEKLHRNAGVNSVAFSPDGKTLASGADDNTVRLWDVVSGQERVRLAGHEGNIRSVAFSPDGKTLASGADDNTVRLWDVPSGRERARLAGHEGSVSSVAFSPDGKTLASGAVDNTVRLWDVPSGRERARLAGHEGSVSSVAFSPDGKTLASGADDNTVRLWDVPSGRERARLAGHEGNIRSVAFSPDGKTLASGADDNTVRLWDVPSGRERARLAGHEGSVSSVAFSPDGKTLASGAVDNTVRLWDVPSGRERARLAGHEGSVSSVAFSPDGKTLASGGDDNTVRLWDVASGQERVRLPRHVGRTGPVAFSPDGKTLASGGDDKSVRLWDVPSGRERARLAGHEGSVSSVAFSPDGKTLASGADDNTVRLWDVASGRERARLPGHKGSVSSVAFSPDGKTLASGGDDKTVRLWDVASGQERARLPAPKGWTSSVAFSPDGKTLASGGASTVLLWDVASGQERAPLPGRMGWTTSVAFSPDGKELASGGSWTGVRLWDLASGRKPEHLAMSEGARFPVVFSVAFSPDGKTLASGGDDKSVRLWDVPSGRERARLAGHEGSVSSVAFSPDGKTLASGANDNTVRLWDVASRTETAILVAGRRNTWVGCITAAGSCVRVDDGTLVVALGADGTVLPLKPPGAHQPLAVSLAGASGAVFELPAGQVLELPVIVRNTGHGRADWVRLCAPEDTSPVQYAVEPTTLPYLEAGETRTIPVRVYLPGGSGNPVAAEFDVRLVATQAYGESSAPVSVRARVQPPLLSVQEARWLKDKDSQAIVVTIANTGRALARAEFALHAPGLKEDPAPVALAASGLAAGGAANLSFALPPGAEIPEKLRVTLAGQNLLNPDGTGWPLFDWEFRDVPVSPPGLPWMVYAAVTLLLLGGAYFQLVYRNPLVLRLTAQPQAIRDSQPADLFRARRLLRLAGRLGVVLRTAGVRTPWMEAAIAFNKTRDPAARAALLSRRLGLSVDGPVQDDASRWTIALPEDFPINVSQLRLYLPLPGDDAAQVRTRLGTPSEVTIVLAADAEQHRELPGFVRDSGGLIVAATGLELTQLLLAQDPVAELAQLIARHVPVTQISPYQTGAGVNRQGLFFGRGALLAQIMGRDPANYLVVGGRQVGKSSLLKAIERQYRNDSSVECHYVVLSSGEGVRTLAVAIGLPDDAGIDAVLEAMRRPRNQRLLILLDEADAFVDRQRSQDYAVLQQLRALSEEGRAFFVLAGFWSLYRQAALDHQSPLKNFGTVLTIGELEPDACRALAVEPMAQVGVRWESDVLVDRLVEQTGQRANLVSIACDEILNVLGKADRVIGPAHLETVLAGNRIRDAVLGWSELSEDANESRLDRIVVYATVNSNGFTLTDVLGMLEAHGFMAEPERIKNSLARLELAFVLGREGNRYQYRVPLQRELILADDTALLLKGELRGMQ